MTNTRRDCDMNDVGIVIIGRNEGERIQRAIRSVLPSRCTIVYVDSDSSDDSVRIARALDVDVIELDASQPLSAARGRNAGFGRLMQIDPAIRYAQFIDGDCELDRSWLRTALNTLKADQSLAIVCGRLRERSPERSIYHQLCNLEWKKPIGPVNSCGGIFMIRADTFAEIGGFNADVSAGEEAVLCRRVREGGLRILRVAARMALHDAGDLDFDQWWRRNIRTGYGGLDVQRHHGVSDFRRALRSAWMWTVGYPMAVVAVGVCGYFIAGLPLAIASMGGLATVLAAQIVRIAVRQKCEDISWRDSLLCACMIMFAKIAHMQGQLRWYCEHWRAASDCATRTASCPTDQPT